MVCLALPPAHWLVEDSDMTSIDSASLWLKMCTVRFCLLDDEHADSASCVMASPLQAWCMRESIFSASVNNNRACQDQQVKNAGHSQCCISNWMVGGVESWPMLNKVCLEPFFTGITTWCLHYTTSSNIQHTNIKTFDKYGTDSQNAEYVTHIFVFSIEF